MSEHIERSPSQAGDRDKDSDKYSDKDPGADPSRQRQAERQAEHESALQQWETEGGADTGAEDRTNGNEVAEIGGTDTREHDG
jgi:hypothetical protein